MRAPKAARLKPRLDGALEKWRHLLPEINFLIHATDEYIVFLDAENDIDWQTDDSYDSKGHKNDVQFNEILNRVAALEATPCAGLAAGVKQQFKRLVAEGLDRGLSHDYASAQSILDRANEYIIARSQETSRQWYLSASTAMTLPFLATGLCLWIWRDYIMARVGETALLLALSAAAGSVGALLSVIGRAGKLHFNCSSGKTLHYLEGASRIWAGSISGVLVALAIKSEFLLAALARIGKGHAIVILMAMISGASERLVNSIISDLSKVKVDKIAGGEEK